MKIDLKNKKISTIITIILAGLLVLIVIVPVKDGIANTQENQQTEYQSELSYSSYYENRLKTMLEYSYGEGTIDVMVCIKVESGKTSIYDGSTDNENVSVEGVLITARVSDENAVSEITYAVSALFGLPTHKVGVIIKK